MESNRMNLRIPLVATCISAARLVASVAAAQCKFSVARVEDVKLCVAEACNVLTFEKVDEAEITFSFGEELSVEIVGIEKDGVTALSESEGMSLLILQEFADSFECRRNSCGVIESFVLVFRGA